MDEKLNDQLENSPAKETQTELVPVKTGSAQTETVEPARAKERVQVNREKEGHELFLRMWFWHYLPDTLTKYIDFTYSSVFKSI